MSEDTRSIIEASIASSRQDGPEDGGPGAEPDSITSDDTPDLGDIAEGDATDEGEGDVEKDGAASKTPEKPVEETKTPEEDDDFSKVPEFEELKNGTKRVNRIPHPRVQKMIAKQVAAAEARVREEVGKEHGEKLTVAEKRIADMEAIGEIMGNEPDRFIAMLADINPAYKAWSKQDGASPKQDTGEAMPKPDAQLADGTPAYSPEGWEKFQSWQAKQIEDRVTKNVAQRYKKFDDAIAAEEMRKAEAPRVRAQIQEAMQSWEDFEPNFDAIVTELRVDSEEAAKRGRAGSLSLEGAYRKVMAANRKKEKEEHQKALDALKTDRNKLREEVLAEIEKRPKSTATTPTTPVQREAAPEESGDTKDVIRAAIRKIKGGRAE